MHETKSKTNNALASEFNVFSLLKFAFPTMIMMLFMGVYTIVDTIFVSRFVNTNALSAINIVTPINNYIVGLSTMLATGGSAIVARKMGAGNEDRARKDFTLIILAGIILGISITIIGLLFLKDIILLLGASEVLLPYCIDYLSILLLFAPASILQVLFQNLIVTAGKPELGMILVVSAGVLNIILDYIFIVILGIGIKGAALGTGLGYLFPSIIGLAFFTFNKGTLYFSHPIIDKAVIIESCLNGSSEMVGQLATAITTFLFNITMMRLAGENGVAAITIMIYTQFLLTTLYIGFSMGVAPVISYNYGSRNSQRLKRVFFICIRFITIISIFIFALSLLFGNRLVSIFSSVGTEVYILASNGFIIFAFGFLFSGFNIFASATFTALSNGKISALISFLRTFGFITGALLILPLIIGINGVWFAVPIAEFVTVFISLTIIWRYREIYHYL